MSSTKLKTALIICTYNRVEYLWQTLDSLRKLDKEPDYYVIVDDCSTEKDIKDWIDVFTKQDNCYAIMKEKRVGIKNSLAFGFDFAFENLHCDIAINLDSDAIVKPDFISRVVDLKIRFPEQVVSGFNCHHPNNPIVINGDDYVMRKHANGINMCMDREQYINTVRPNLLKKEGNWDYDSTHDKCFVITKPSVVEHIGKESAMGHIGADVSCDFWHNETSI